MIKEKDDVFSYKMKFVSYFTLFVLQEHDIDIAQLVEQLSSLSLDNTTSDDVHHKLAELVKTRNIMKFAAQPNKTSSLFSPEEISLLKNMPKGT